MYFDKSAIVERTVDIIGNNSAVTFFNIAYGIDKNFMLGAAISATSIVINTTIPLAFHFFTYYIDSETTSRFEAMANRYHVNIHIYKVNTKLLADLPQDKWPCSAYFRLTAFDYLAEKLDTLLYLDADVMCKNNLAELSTLDFKTNICAVVPDISTIREQCALRLENPAMKTDYFNSGVMFTHLKNWTANQLTERTLAFIKENTTLKYPDQDALNILLCGKTVLLPRKFNCIYSIKSELQDKTHLKFKNIINDESVFIHYVGTTKPWSAWGQYPSTIYFQTAYKASTWHDVKLLTPANALQWKKKSKHAFRKYHFLDGILARIAYYYLK
ncbi:glycosyltransferase family 8 protein [Symbiopectobacterium purcellii]|uniref:glycosyltransferase family 8 protein n=1 Tax=Symbiopectobacterium purcellii TaxID=2871826 RepID=UPI003F840A96